MKRNFTNLLFFLLCLSSFAFLQAQDEFITTWKTDNPGTSNDNQITIPTGDGAFSYTVDWGDGSPDSTVYTGDATHTYASAGTYTVKVSGDFPHLQFGYGQDNEKLLSVEHWGTQQWISMNHTFYRCSNFVLNATDTPDLSLVTDMFRTFAFTDSFNQDINSWDVSHVTNMSSMFSSASAFNQNLDSWDVSNVTDMTNMFIHASSFNGNINSWNVGKVTSMSGMFLNTAFNQDIGEWDVSNVVYMKSMFEGASNFNQNIGNWNVDKVKRMSSMFENASAFDGDIGSWNVGIVQDMTGMFAGATSFNQDINGWDVSSVWQMGSFKDPMMPEFPSYGMGMFEGATAFNQNIDNWDVSGVIGMGGMFAGATAFNQDISGWNVANVMDMTGMFAGATAFNQDISSWDVSSVAYMGPIEDPMLPPGYPMEGLGMFQGATSFDQDISMWDVSQVLSMDSMFDNAGLSTENYDALLEAWSALTLQSNVSFSAGSSMYCDAEANRKKIITDFGWTIIDQGRACDSDRDGVVDTIDQCPNTPEGAVVDSNGCTPSLSYIDGISLASFEQSLDLSSNQTGSLGFTFDPSGTRLYTLGADGTKEIDQYTLSEGFNITTATYLQSYTVGSTNPSEIIFNTDGSKMYVGSYVNNDIKEYDLSIAYDISTASFVDSFVFTTQEGNPFGIDFNFDGSKMFMTGDLSDTVYEYDLSTPFSVSTATVTGNTFSVTDDGSVRGLTFGSNGGKMYLVGDQTNTVYEYDLNPAFDITSATLADSYTITEDVSPYDVAFNSSNTRMYVIGQSNAAIFEYSFGASYEETLANDGSIDNDRALKLLLSHSTFVDLGTGQLTPSQVSIVNLPAGLTPVFTIDSPTEVTMTLMGKATANNDEDDVDDLQFVFTDAAFSNDNAPITENSGALSPYSSNIGVDFNDNPPVIDSFTPTGAGNADTVVITGNYFTDATQVTFGGTNAVSFSIDSATQITAVVGEGSSGIVAVATKLATATASGFTYYYPPTAVDISKTTIAENLAIGTGAAQLSAIDANSSETFTYTLATGAGDVDNDSFRIVDDMLNTAAVFDYETKSTYSIRIRVTDAQNLHFEKEFSITITDVAEDSDKDGVNDNQDQCTGTPSGETVDIKGCSDTQKDSDGDGIKNSDDICPGTPSGESVDANGCSSNQKDSDTDGVTDNIDLCPNTPTGEEVDAEGCSSSQKDTDFDGVADNLDMCSESPQDESVDENGCSDSQKDTDNDGISDALDSCSDTPIGEIADDKGCSDSQKGTDDETVQNTDGEVGCVANCDSKKVTAAEAFTPNGDGINDGWVIKGIENHPNSIVNVYNRWGHKVFSAIGYQNDWGGTYRNNNKKLPTGSYYYVIDLANGSAPQKGWIFINY